MLQIHERRSLLPHLRQPEPGIARYAPAAAQSPRRRGDAAPVDSRDAKSVKPSRPPSAETLPAPVLLILVSSLVVVPINVPRPGNEFLNKRYFHDNSQPDLATLIDTYSQFILPFIPRLNPLGVQPGQHAMTAAQRAALLDFLSHF